MFPIVLAALSLVGAPANTNVVCGSTPYNNEQGWTWWNTNPPTIVLGVIPCQAIVYASSTTDEQRKIRLLNPDFDPPIVEGAGLLILLHEAIHAAGDHDETSTECEAMRLLPELLSKAGVDDPMAFRSAAGWDAVLPSAYHQYAC